MFPFTEEEKQEEKWRSIRNIYILVLKCGYYIKNFHDKFLHNTHTTFLLWNDKGHRITIRIPK